MRRIVHTSLAVGATALALGTAGPARADFIYTLTSTATTGGPGAPTHLDMQLTMANAAVESGSFTASRNCSPGIPPCISNTGNFDEITLALTSPFAAILINNSPDIAFDQTNVSLTFAPGGSITSGSIFEVNSFFELNPLTITGSSWSATFNSDAFQGECPSAGCAAVGTASFVSTPEPASFALLGTGLLGFGLIRRWRRMF